MSLLDGLKRKKRKHIREQLLDAPTLFAGVGNDSSNAEKKISVLSAASGKPARRVKQGRVSQRPVRMIRPFYVVLLIGTIALAGVWQTGVLDRDSAVSLAAKFDTLLQAGMSALAPSQPASTHAEIVQSPVSASPSSTETGRTVGEHAGQPASIERVALTNGVEPPPPSQPVPALGAIEAALNRTDPAVEATPPAISVSPEAKRSPVPATPRAAPHGTSTPATQGGSPAASTSPQPAKDKLAPEKTAERKVQVARTKEQDPDAQLMEALLLHLRKMESAKGGAR